MFFYGREMERKKRDTARQKKVFTFHGAFMIIVLRDWNYSPKDLRSDEWISVKIRQDVVNN